MATIDPANINTFQEWLNGYKANAKNVVRDASTGHYLVLSRETGGPTKRIEPLPRATDEVLVLNAATATPAARGAAEAHRDETLRRHELSAVAIREEARGVEQDLLSATAAWNALREQAATTENESERVTAKSIMAARAAEVGDLTRGLIHMNFRLSQIHYPIRQANRVEVQRRVINWASHDERITTLVYNVFRRDTPEERMMLL